LLEKVLEKHQSHSGSSAYIFFELEMNRRGTSHPKRILSPKFVEKIRDGKPSKASKTCKHVEGDDVESFRYRDCRPSCRVLFQLPYEGSKPHVAVDPRYQECISLGVDDVAENVLEVSVKIVRGKAQLVRYDGERSKHKKVVKILADGSPIVFFHFGDFREKHSGKRKPSPTAAADMAASKRPRRLEMSVEGDVGRNIPTDDYGPAVAMDDSGFLPDFPESLYDFGHSDVG
jgi:hypothetical protein